MSGWPSGLRRQTQVKNLSCQRIKEFWSSKEGVGSNPTSDKCFLRSILDFVFQKKYSLVIMIDILIANLHLLSVEVRGRPYIGCRRDTVKSTNLSRTGVSI
jgi:hypothetical protein